MVRIVSLLLLVSQVGCDTSLDGYWMSWKTEFNKKYSSPNEEACRRAIWQENVLEATKHNTEAAAGRRTFTMGTNHLSDMTPEEINRRLNGLRGENIAHHDANKSFLFLTDFSVPYHVDWVTKGLVSPVQNQGMCGSCWAFSAIGSLEAQMKKKSGRLVPLSAQNLVDCSVKDGNHGCKGGFISKAFSYIQQNNGIDSAWYYPYEAREGSCRYSSENKAGHCTGFWILPRNESVLRLAVAAVGPVSVGINAKLPSFHRYKSGIYYDPLCDSRAVNHAVLVVGYGKENGLDYWLIKNSWGTAWGENGYFRLAQNRNHCGIANFAIVPKV
ncbi:cathepsin S, ortholog 1 [Trichomycterus rosablanca]|uniref:cathepsin S, ortholog 1 n=1 Tax=Trichomycterus rosablanca TaxID=2290929 RepID=UPI002F35A79B